MARRSWCDRWPARWRSRRAGGAPPGSRPRRAPTPTSACKRRWRPAPNPSCTRGKEENMTSRIPQDIRDYPFDLIVIGAGINGAGIAREAAMRGLAALLLDKGDISAGTTQWSTRLIHGGLRYLEHYEVPLVRESLKDREILF